MQKVYNSEILNLPFEQRGQRFYTKVIDPPAKNWEGEFYKFASREFEREWAALNKAYRGAKALPSLAAIEVAFRQVLEARTDNWRRGFIPLMEGLFTDWAEAWTQELGVDFELVKPTLVQTIFNDYIPHFVKRHQGVSESAVINLLARAREEGWDTLELQDRLQGRYSQWSTLRAEMIARTETIRLENRASLNSYAAGGVKTVEWFATPDDRLCPFCRKLHQHKFATGEALFKMGEAMTVPGGVLKMNYEDVRHPPLHVFCRCVLLPVIIVGDPPAVKPTPGLDEPNAPATPQRSPGESMRERLREAKAESQAKVEAVKAELDLLGEEAEAVRSEIQEIFKRRQEASADEVPALTDALDAAKDKFLAVGKKRTAVAQQLQPIEDAATAAARRIVAPHSAKWPEVDREITGAGKTRRATRRRWLEDSLDEFARMIAPSVRENTFSGVLFVKFSRRSGRAYYSDYDEAVRLYDNHYNRDAVQTVIHEFGHWLEYSVDGLQDKAQAFLDRRTAGEKAQRLSDLTGIRYSASEVAKKDKFKHPYMGKIYRGGATEIISMGLEEIWVDPAGFAETDPDYFDFIYENIMHDSEGSQ